MKNKNDSDWKFTVRLYGFAAHNKTFICGRGAYVEGGHMWKGAPLILVVGNQEYVVATKIDANMSTGPRQLILVVARNQECARCMSASGRSAVKVLNLLHRIPFVWHDTKCQIT